MIEPSSRIVLPGLSSEEEASKKLAVQLLQTIERGYYSNREILGAIAVLGACVIKAKYKKQGEWQEAYRSLGEMTRHVINQG